MVLKLAKETLGDNSEKSVKLFKKKPLRAFDNVISKSTIKDFSLYGLRDIFMGNTTTTSQLLGLDVTASGLQLLGLFTRNVKALNLTNVFELKEDHDLNHDIYYVIHRRVCKEYPISISLGRNIYKGLIMRLSYGESNYSRKKFLTNYFKLNLPKGEFDRIENKSELLQSLAKAYEKAVYDEFPIFKVFSNQLQTIVKQRMNLNLPIFLKVLDIYYSTQYYNEDKATTYSFRAPDGRIKKVTLHIPRRVDSSDYNRFEAKPNNRKVLRATLPNLVHHLNSLLIGVIKDFREAQKPLFTIHDAFYVRLIDTEFLKDSYFKSLERLDKENLWLSFLESNIVDLDDIIYSDWSLNKKRLAEELNENISNFRKEAIGCLKPIDFSRKRSDIILN